MVLGIGSLRVSGVALTDVIFYLNQYANLLLAVITGVYASLTYCMIKEMENARKAESTPYIRATLDPLGGEPIKAVLKIQNVGKGAAMNIKLDFSLEPSTTARNTWTSPLLGPNESKRFALPDKTDLTLKEIVEKYEKLVVISSYNDIFNEKHEYSISLDLRKFEEVWSKSLMLLDSTLKEEIKGISKKLEAISKSLNTEGIKIKEYKRDI